MVPSSLSSTIGGHHGASLVTPTVWTKTCSIASWPDGVATQVRETYVQRRRGSRSSEGRYHPARFRDAAESLGLEVADSGKGLGWDTTTIPRATEKVYAPAVDRLTRALKDWQPTGTAYGDRDRVRLACSCDPPRRTLMAQSKFELGPVICEICQAEFRPA